MELVLTVIVMIHLLIFLTPFYAVDDTEIQRNLNFKSTESDFAFDSFNFNFQIFKILFINQHPAASI